MVTRVSYTQFQTCGLNQYLIWQKKLAVTKEGFEDVVQEGNMALFMHLTELCGAGENENIEDEILEVIEAAMKECIRDQTGESENENAMVGKVSLVSRAVEHLKSQNGTDPSAQELSEYTSVPADELSSILELLKRQHKRMIKSVGNSLVMKEKIFNIIQIGDKK